MGDIHGAWGDANDAYNKAIERLGDPQLLIQVGDYGYFPSDGINPITKQKDPYHYPKKSGLWERRFNHHCQFIDGNHDNHEELRLASDMCDPNNEGKRVMLHGGGTLWEYVPRGVCRGGVLYVGGASSVDKDSRQRLGHYWSQLEELTREEVTPILDAKHDDVKVVISHTCPAQFDMRWACNPQWGNENKLDQTRVLLDEILDQYKPEYWYFGHWHQSGSGLYTHDDGRTTKWRCLGICEIAYHEL